jgi:hypothetical protein
MPPKSNLGICSRILRPMQKIKNICWFLAVIVVMFYSQRSRKVIMNSSKTWNTQYKVIKLFRDLLYDRYLIVGSDPHKSKEYETFNEDTFIEILQELYNMNEIKFPYNPKENIQYNGFSYLCRLYKLLGVDYKAFEILFDDDIDDVRFYYSRLNKEYDCIDNPSIPIPVYKDDESAPPILIIANYYHCKPYPNNEIKDARVKLELASFKEIINYNEIIYTLDSVIIMNTNELPCNHSIVGLTCKQTKYVYNGYYLKNKNFPCQLIKHNWNIRSDRDFYLSRNDCKLHDNKQPDSFGHIYNFSKDERICIYVRKNENSDTSFEEDVEKYLETREAAILEEEIKKARLNYEEQEMQKKRKLSNTITQTQKASQQK